MVSEVPKRWTKAGRQKPSSIPVRRAPLGGDAPSPGEIDLSVDGVRAAETASDIRFDRVAAIRTAIAEGSYETPEKLDLALERLLDRIS